MTKVESFKVLCEKLDSMSIYEYSDVVDCSLAIKAIMEWQIEHGYHLPAMKRVRRIQCIKANIEARLLQSVLKDPKRFPEICSYFQEMRYLPYW